jgi:hypothetical protein
MSEITLEELLLAAPRTKRKADLSPRQAREELGQWLGQLGRDVEQAGPSSARASALACLRYSFLGFLTALSAPRIERVSVNVSETGPGDEGRSQRDARPEARVYLSEDRLFNQLRAAAEALDNMLAWLEPPPPPEPKTWADDDKLLEQLQPLLGALAARNGEAALAELGLLAERLRAQDIEMRLADDTTADWFTLYDGDADGYVTVTPAIAVRGELRKRGEARRPRDTRPRGDVTVDAAGSAEQEGTPT